MTIDFIEVMRTAAIHTNAMDGATEHIVDQHGGNCTLTIGWVGLYPFRLAGRICRFLAPGFSKNTV